MEPFMKPKRQSALIESNLEAWQGESAVLTSGAILLCKGGTARFDVNFKQMTLRVGGVLTLFPNDAVQLSAVSADFKVEILHYAAAMLREASMQLEHTVYSALREDRCRNGAMLVTNIIEHMFGLLRLYFEQDDCTCVDHLVVLQLKAFFLGFYDYLYRFPGEQMAGAESRRTQELFNHFMMLIERDFRQSHDVVYYAGLLHITPKYLNTIVQRITHHTPKVIIDQYLILQIKQQLRAGERSIKQIAWELGFRDASFFTRYFKTHVGQTPQQFRKQIK